MSTELTARTDLSRAAARLHEVMQGWVDEDSEAAAVGVLDAIAAYVQVVEGR